MPVAGLLYLLLWAPGTATGLFALFTVTRALGRARSGDRALFSVATAGHLRFSTLTRLCEALGCRPGDLLTYETHE
ncbi:hypothetical protein GCM10022419_040570 [Nonomuraea rosea]|uniref:HTH cro/C1-type domain-containing protein n=1 Tax=Nonomuraea rosea TaxID=638574 RepID=A0ABP6WU94_9ACTN